jgi:hypothetical protein
MAGSPLISVPPSPASPANATVAGNAWWPAIDRNAARDAIRLGEIITDARLTAALEGAWITITSDLAQWQADLAAGLPNATPPVAGPADLGAVTAPQLAALQVPARPPYWADWNSGNRDRYSPGCAPFGITQPRYTPARAAWLAGTMTDSVSGQTVSILTILFTRAVRYAAAAELTESYRDNGMTGKGDIRAEAMTDTAADYRRIAIQSVRDILGVTRVTSELI